MSGPFAPNRDHLTCCYCHLSHPKVEAGGIWYCPNFACSGPGGASHRMTLKSYTEVSDSRHTVDADEWLTAATAYATKIVTTDAPLAAHILASVRKRTRGNAVPDSTASLAPHGDPFRALIATRVVDNPSPAPTP